jgi:multidrug efflux system membrane fusion protein
MIRHAFALALVALTLVACNRERDVELQPIPVRTEVAKRSEFAPQLTLLGVVRAAESIPITARQRGSVTYPSRFASGLRTGERVTSGETIAVIHNEQVVSAQTQARLQMDAAAGDFERVKRSHDAGLVSAAEFSATKLRAELAREQYAAASRDVATLRIVAPANGTLVVAKPFAAGTMVDAASVLAEVVTNGAPVVESSVAASERALLKPAQKVKFTTRTTPPWNGSGAIAEVASVVDAAGTSRVVASIDKSARDIPPPGSGVELLVELDHRPDVLTVPEDAIVAGTDGTAIFVTASAEGYAGRFRVKRVHVETAGRANGRVEVLSGLRDGDRVVVSGADALSDDAFVVEGKE